MIATNRIAIPGDIEGLEGKISDQLFARTVTNSRYGVPNAKKIYDSDEFQAWLPKQPKEIQALRNSADPKDHIRIFKRFLSTEGLKDAKGKVVQIDKNRKAKKKEFDDLHKSTVKAQKGKPDTSAGDARTEEAEGFNSKEDDDDI